jgi:hypothetical protein
MEFQYMSCKPTRSVSIYVNFQQLPALHGVSDDFDQHYSSIDNNGNKDAALTIGKDKYTSDYSNDDRNSIDISSI